jgi:hypothetical protein
MTLFAQEVMPKLRPINSDTPASTTAAPGAEG